MFWTDKRIQAAQEEKRPSSSSPFLAVSILLFVRLSFILPAAAEATVCAYMDVRGEIHYVGANNSHANKFRRIDKGKGNPKGLFIRPIAQPKSSHPSHPSINAFIQAAANEHGVDPLLIKAVIKTESNFDPSAVSPKGAQGLMQLMPATARDLQVADPFDPQKNISGGTKYLRSLLDSYDGDVVLSLAAYNAGPGKVKGAIPNIPETRVYVAKVLDNYQSFRSDK